MATIKEVAELAEVSTATVSYVLNGTGKVAPATRERVLAAIAQLNYQPSHAARSLRGRSQTLGLVLPGQGRLADPTLAELLAGIADAASSRGYQLLLATATEGQAEAELHLQLSRTGRADGLVLLSPRTDDERAALLRSHRVPHVCVGSPPDVGDSPAVAVDMAAGAAHAVRYLLGLGHQRIAMILLPTELTTSEPCFAGYTQALTQAGLELDPMLVIEAGLRQEDGYQAMQELLALPEPPTAVLACSDELAFGAMHLLHDEGLNVGADVSVVGCDDVPLAAHIHPPLTTLRQPRRQVGARAATLLIDLIEQRSVAAHNACFEPQLIIRRSCAAPSLKNH